MTEVSVSKPFKRADGVWCEKVSESYVEGGRYRTKKYVRPVGSSIPRGKDHDAASAHAEAERILGGETPKKQTSSSDVVAAKADIKERLMQLKEMHSEGFVSQEEYVERKKVLAEEYKALLAAAKKGAPQRTAVAPQKSEAVARRGPNPMRRPAARKAAAVKHEEESASSEDDSSSSSSSSSSESDSDSIEQYPHNTKGSGQPKRNVDALNPMKRTGIDGLYEGEAVTVIERIEKQLKDRRQGPEHAFEVVKTRVTKELLSDGVVRVTRIDKVYDGYTGNFLRDKKEVKMKPNLKFHDTLEWDKDNEFEMDDYAVEEEEVVEAFHMDHWKEEDEERKRIEHEALSGREYRTHNVNIAATSDFGWDGVYRYGDGTPKDGKGKGRGKGKKKTKKSNAVLKKLSPRRAYNSFLGHAQPEEEKEASSDPWGDMDDNWGDEPQGEARGKTRAGKGKYSDGGKKFGVFKVKKKAPDDLKGEDPKNVKGRRAERRDRKANAQRHEDDGAGGGAFQAGEAWGEHDEFSGDHKAGGSHHAAAGWDRWK